MRLVALLILALALAAIPAQAEPIAALAAPPRILVIGDGIAVGGDATQPGAAYVARVAAALGAAESTTVRPAANLDTAADAWQASGAAGWDVAILAIADGTSAQGVTDDALAVSIGVTGTRVICVTPFDDDTPGAAARATHIRAHCPGGSIADVYAASAGRDDLRAPVGAPTFAGTGLATGRAPNNAGHAQIAATILGALDADTRLYLPGVMRP